MAQAPTGREQPHHTRGVRPGRGRRPRRARRIRRQPGATIDQDQDLDADFIGDPVFGVDALAWDARVGAWSPLATSNAGAGAPATLDTGSPDATTAARWLDRGRERFHFLLTPAAGVGNGYQPSVIALDYIEARITYRLP